MTANDRRSLEVDRLLSRLEPSQRAIADALRSFLLKSAPELHEEVKWGTPCYLGKKLVCSIAAHSDHTNLEFYHGAALKDPQHLLEGTGKSLRHVKIYAVAEMRRADLLPLLREAVALDSA